MHDIGSYYAWLIAKPSPTIAFTVARQHQRVYKVKVPFVRGFNRSVMRRHERPRAVVEPRNNAGSPDVIRVTCVIWLSVCAARPAWSSGFISLSLLGALDSGGRTAIEFIPDPLPHVLHQANVHGGQGSASPRRVSDPPESAPKPLAFQLGCAALRTSFALCLRSRSNASVITSLISLSSHRYEFSASRDPRQVGMVHAY